MEATDIISPAIRLVGRDVLFVHWPVDPEMLRANLPEQVEIDTFEGTGWVSAVLQEVASVGLDAAPVSPLPAFPQLDFRTYVSHDGEPGVYFLTCDTGQQLNTLVGSRTFGLPFTHASMEFTRRIDQFVVRSRRKDDPQARFDVRYGPAGTVGPVESGLVPEFLIERYRYYTPATGETVETGATGELVAGNVEREPWQVAPAEAAIRTNTLFEAAGFEEPLGEPLVQHCPEFEAQFVGTERLSQ